MKIIYIFLICEILMFKGFAQENDSIQAAKFPGGEAALMAYIEEHTFISLSEPLDRMAEYRVRINFTVDESGAIHHVMITGVPPSLQMGLERTFMRMPEWEPAKRGNQAVTGYIDMRFSCIVNGNRLNITYFEGLTSEVHRPGNSALKFGLVAGAIALMLALLLL